PRLFVSHPGGTIEERPLKSAGSHVAAKVRLPRKGEATVELLATGSGGPQVVAIRRIFVGTAPPRSPPPEPSGRDPGVKGVEAAIARLRAQHGLPSLRRDAELDGVAELHSREMARTGTFAHVLGAAGSSWASRRSSATRRSTKPPAKASRTRRSVDQSSPGRSRAPRCERSWSMTDDSRARPPKPTWSARRTRSPRRTRRKEAGGR